MVGEPQNIAANAGVSFRRCSVQAREYLLAARSIQIILFSSSDAVIQVTTPCDNESLAVWETELLQRPDGQCSLPKNLVLVFLRQWERPESIQ